MSGNSKLTRGQVRMLRRCFCLDVDASKTAALAGVSRNTTNAHFMRYRRLIYAYQLAEMKGFLGEVEVDESYFGPARQRGQMGKRKAGRGTAKQPVFGIYERGGRVYTELIPDCSRASLHGVIRGRVSPEAVIYSDDWRGYDGLVDVGYDRHVRISKATEGFARGRRHINGIEAFWSFTKRRLAKFNGVRSTFELHLKECEWRYRKTPAQLDDELRTLIRHDGKSLS